MTAALLIYVDCWLHRLIERSFNGVVLLSGRPVIGFISGSAGKNRDLSTTTGFSSSKPQVTIVKKCGLVGLKSFSPHF